MKAQFNLAVFAALLASQAAQGAAPLFADETVARGKTLEIKRSALDEAVTGFKANAAARGERVPLPTAEIEARMLDKLVTVALLAQRATESERTNAAAKADKYVADLQERNVSLAAYTGQLQAMGTTPARFRQQFVDQASSELVIEREVGASIKITDEQARKFYDENVKQFLTPESFRVSHIYFSTFDALTRAPFSGERRTEKKALAEKAAARAKAGEDFAALVREFTDDRVTKEKGGEITFAKGQFPPEVEQKARELTPNYVSGVIDTAVGFHIIKLHERNPPRVIEFAKVEARIKDALKSVEIDKARPAYIEKLRAEAGVELLLNK